MRGLFAGTFVVKVDRCFAQENWLDRLKNRGPIRFVWGDVELCRDRVDGQMIGFSPRALRAHGIVRSFPFVIESNNALWGFVLDDTRDCRGYVVNKPVGLFLVGRGMPQ